MQESFLIFELKKEYLAVNVDKIIEVIDYVQVTEIPDTPKYIKGIINYRGDILPVIDMRLKFNIPEKKDKGKCVIIIMSMIVRDKKVVLGSIADSVKTVVEADIMKSIKLPEIGTKFNTEYITGIIEIEGEMIVLLDIEKIFTVDEITIINEAGTSN